MYPAYEIAPIELKDLAGNCGPVSVWMMLLKYGIEAEPQEIIDRCGYTEEFGCFAICMANALHRYGLRVEFYTDFDPDPKPIEVTGYSRAKNGVSINSAIPLAKLLRKMDEGKSIIVSYLARGGTGHFSPVVPSNAKKVGLAYAKNGMLLKSEFNKRWRSPGILRQCIVVA